MRNLKQIIIVDFSKEILNSIALIIVRVNILVLFLIANAFLAKKNS